MGTQQKKKGCVIFLVTKVALSKAGSNQCAVPLSNKPKTTKFLTILKNNP
jgi:hypothetical protein